MLKGVTEGRMYMKKDLSIIEPMNYLLPFMKPRDFVPKNKTKNPSQKLEYYVQSNVENTV